MNIFLLVIIIAPRLGLIHSFSYSDGTTDVTRTFHFGNPSAYEKVIHHHLVTYYFVKKRLRYIMCNIVQLHDI